MMDLTEKTVGSNGVYQGAIVNVRRDVARLPNGKEAGREVVEHPGGVAILPLHDDGTVLLVRQWRYPFGRVLLEAPAGKLERGEEPRLCALRELSEETGLEAGELVELGSIYPSPGYCDEVLYLYLARDLTPGPCHPDEDEFLELERMPLDTLVELVLRGEVQDAKTVALALKAKLLTGR